MKFYHYLSMLNPFTYADDQTKKDLKILFISLGFLFLLLPFFLKTLQKYHPFERRIQTRFPQSYVSVNFKNPQARPSILDIKYGDSVQIKDTEGNTLFNYRYKGEDHLYFNIDKKNNIILNDEIIGKRILSKNDLPLTNNLEIIHSNIDLLEKDVSNQKNKNLTFSIGKNVNASTISNFPDEIFYLDLSKNIKIEYLKSADNLRKIEILDNSQREINSLFNFSDFENLKQLNLENTNLLQTYVLRTLSKMHHLNLSKNGLSEILAIDKMDFLRTISLDDNYEINDISTLLTRNMLTDYSIKNNYNISENQVDELDKELGRTKITKYLNTREFSQLEVLIFWVFMIIALLLSLISLRIFIRSLVKILKEKPLPLNSEISENIPKSFDRHLEKKQLDLCFKKNQLALPKGDNALERAQAIATIIPKDKEIQKLYKSAYKQSVKKIKNHFKKNEYEPAYLIAQGAFEIAKAEIFKKWIIKSRKKLLENNHKMKFVKIEGGEFEMGDFTGSLSNAPAHKVKLSSFKISETLVTNKQYCEFLNSKGNLKDAGVNWININSPYSQIEIHNGKFKPKEGYSAFPVFNVAWFGAQRFCNWAGGRLPTEAEYEFVARNRGQKISYSHGNNISRKKANFLVDKNDKNWHSVVPVKSFKANPLKIYDLSGNLLEWCLDNYDSDFYLESSVMNPMGPKANALSRSSEGKVVRGGAWCFEKERMQTYRRGAAKPTTRNNFIGFRVVM